MNSHNPVKTAVTLTFLIVLGTCGWVRGSNFVCPRIHTVPIPNFSAGGGPGTADISGNGTVDFPDLAILSSQWLQCNTQPQIFQGLW